MAQLPVQALEVGAHAAEVAGELVGQRDDLAYALDRPIVGERAHHAALDTLDLGVDARALGEQRAHARARIGIGLLSESRELARDGGKPAFGGGRARAHQALDEAQGADRVGRQLEDFFARAFGQAARQPPLRQPVGQIELRRLRQIDAGRAQQIDLMAKPLEQHRGRQRLVALVQQRAQQGHHGARLVGGEQTPQRLLAQLAQGKGPGECVQRADNVQLFWILLPLCRDGFARQDFARNIRASGQRFQVEVGLQRQP